jgi:hypothetical protein
MKNKPTKLAAPGVTIRRNWKPLFLANLARLGIVKIAADAAGVGRMTAYEHREKDKEFAKQWDEVMQNAADLLEAEARRRAVEGVKKYVHHKGVIVTVPVDRDGNVVTPGDPATVTSVPLVEHEYSDNLLQAMLRAKRPNEFRDNVNVTNDACPTVDEPAVMVYTAPPGQRGADSCPSSAAPSPASTTAPMPRSSSKAAPARRRPPMPVRRFSGGRRGSRAPGT